jgi:hypothetical protein
MKRIAAVVLFGAGVYLLCYSLPPSTMLLAPLYALTLAGFGICCCWIAGDLWRAGNTGTY